MALQKLNCMEPNDALFVIFKNKATTNTLEVAGSETLMNSPLLTVHGT